MNPHVYVCPNQYIQKHVYTYIYIYTYTSLDSSCLLLLKLSVFFHFWRGCLLLHGTFCTAWDHLVPAFNT